MTNIAPAAPIALRVWPASQQSSRLARAAFLAVLGSLLLTVSAKVQVPFWPVPMTMQTYVVVLLGVAYGGRLGAATVALYLMEGALGLPVFAGTPERGLGLAYMAGPTGGYLMGFVLAAGLAGRLAERGLAHSLPGLGATMLAGHAIIFVPGVAWLATLIGFDKAIAVGLVPFLAAMVLKVGLGVVTVALLERALRR